MRLKKIDSQEASVVHIAKVILFVEMVNTVVNNATFANLAEGLLPISHTRLHIIAKKLLINRLLMLNV